jgi:uncharacterized protein with GYD domain
MPTYVSLIKYTQQGLSSIKDAPKRLEAARQSAKAAGGSLKAVYFVMGQYDLIAISEAPDDEAAATAAVASSAQGNVKTETLRAFTESEFLKMIASLP